MVKLVVCEKPSVARDVSRILHCNKRGEGCFIGDEYIVTNCIGHLVQLYEPSDYDEKYKKWVAADLPILPAEFKLKPIQKVLSQLKIVKALMNSEKIDSIIEATDSGREGELIYRYLYNYTKCTKPFKRLWISSLTDSAIKDGFENLKPSSDYDNLYLSAKCRSECDQIVGINASRIFSLKYNATLSIGRVQTPILSIIVNRQKEINDFVSKPYWEVKAVYNNFSGVWFDEKTKENRFYDKSKAEAIANKVKGTTGFIKNITNVSKKDTAPQLYDLTELQRDGNRKYGFSAKQTLDITQSLYETHKLVTYPRTDSRYVSKDVVPTFTTRLNAIDIEPFSKYVAQIKSLPIPQFTKKVVDDTKVTDHHALIVTETKPNLSKLSKEELKIYYLIVKRFLSIFFPTHDYLLTTIIATSQNETFISKGKTVVNLGWMALYKDIKENDHDKEDEEKEQELPKCNKGDTLKFEDAIIMDKKTKAPSFYTEASLLSAMDNAKKFIDEEEMQKNINNGVQTSIVGSMAKNFKLGTTATRADIIERLIKVGYVIRNKKSLMATDKGIKLIEIVPTELKTPEMTGKWEAALEEIAKGKMSADEFMDSIKSYTRFIVKDSEKVTNVKFENTVSTNIEVKDSLGSCPECQSPVIQTKVGWGCSAWKLNSCKFTIWATNPIWDKYKKKPTATIVKQLLKSGKTHVKGFTDYKDGSTFDSDVILIKENGYWNLKIDFGTKTTIEKQKDIKSVGVCPICKKGNIIEATKLYGWACTQWKNGCRFFIGEKCGIKINIEQVKQLIKNNETEVINGFTSKDGISFNAKVIIKDGKLYLKKDI